MKRYVIVTANGTLRRSDGGPPSLYDTPGKAQNQCRRDGDSVVEVEIDLTREPVFIRQRKVSGG